MTEIATKASKPKRRLKNVVVDEISFVDNPAVPDAKFVVAKRDAASLKVEDVCEQTVALLDLKKGMSLQQEIENREAWMTQELMNVSASAIGQLMAVKSYLRHDEIADDTKSAVKGMLKKFGISFGEVEKADTGGDGSEGDDNTTPDAPVEKSGDDTENEQITALTATLAALQAKVDELISKNDGDGAGATATETVDGGGEGDETSESETTETVAETTTTEKSFLEQVNEEFSKREQRLAQKRIEAEAEADAAQGKRLAESLAKLAEKFESTEAKLTSISERVDRATGNC